MQSRRWRRNTLPHYLEINIAVCLPIKDSLVDEKSEKKKTNECVPDSTAPVHRTSDLACAPVRFISDGLNKTCRPVARVIYGTDRNQIVNLYHKSVVYFTQCSWRCGDSPRHLNGSRPRLMDDTPR